MRKLRLYIDTSVWNFFFADDAPEKKEITCDFFDLVKKGKYEIYISPVVFKEINNAPQAKRDSLAKLISDYSPIELEVTGSAGNLALLYIKKGIVPAKKEEDALHVGIATVAELDALVSWNFKHLANLRKSELFYSASLEAGYFKKLEIITPMEVSSYEG